LPPDSGVTEYGGAGATAFGGMGGWDRRKVPRFLKLRPL